MSTNQQIYEEQIFAKPKFVHFEMFSYFFSTNHPTVAINISNRPEPKRFENSFRSVFDGLKFIRRVSDSVGRSLPAEIGLDVSPVEIPSARGLHCLPSNDRTGVYTADVRARFNTRGPFFYDRAWQ